MKGAAFERLLILGLKPMRFFEMTISMSRPGNSPFSAVRQASAGSSGIASVKMSW